MNNLSEFLFEKLKINKSCSDKAKCERYEEVIEYAKTLPYEFKIETPFKSYEASFSLIYDNKFTLTVDFPEYFLYELSWYNENGNELYSDKNPFYIVSADWSNILIPEKFIEYVRNIRKTENNRKRINKLLEIADKLEEKLL